MTKSIIRRSKPKSNSKSPPALPAFARWARPANPLRFLTKSTSAFEYVLGSFLGTAGVLVFGGFLLGLAVVHAARAYDPGVGKFPPYAGRSIERWLITVAGRYNKDKVKLAACAVR